MKQFIEAFVHPTNGILFIDHGGYESRNESTMALFKEAFGLIGDKRRIRDIHFYIDTGDVSSKINHTPTFGYTMAEDVVPCPDFIFDKYVECGINSYEETVNRVLDKGERKYAISKLFWTGNLSIQPLRHRLYELGCQNDDRMEIIPMDWERVAAKGRPHNYTSYISRMTRQDTNT